MVALPASFALSPRVSLAIVALCILPALVGKCLDALWRLPDWVGKWLDVRDRWHRHRP